LGPPTGPGMTGSWWHWSTIYIHFDMIFPLEPLIACYISIVFIVIVSILFSYIYIYIFYIVSYYTYYIIHIYIYILDYIECGCRPRFFGAKKNIRSSSSWLYQVETHVQACPAREVSNLGPGNLGRGAAKR